MRIVIAPDAFESGSDIEVYQAGEPHSPVRSRICLEYTNFVYEMNWDGQFSKLTAAHLRK